MGSERDGPQRRRDRPGLEEVARRRLGRNLRLLYAGVLNQPLPERFTRLLDELGERTGTDTDREGSR